MSFEKAREAAVGEQDDMNTRRLWFAHEVVVKGRNCRVTDDIAEPSRQCRPTNLQSLNLDRQNTASPGRQRNGGIGVAGVKSCHSQHWPDLHSRPHPAAKPPIGRSQAGRLAPPAGGVVASMLDGEGTQRTPSPSAITILSVTPLWACCCHVPGPPTDVGSAHRPKKNVDQINLPCL